MKQIFVRKGEIFLEDVPPPTVDDGEVLVANAFSAVSIGTESSIIRETGKGLSLLRVLRDAELRKRAMQVVSRRGMREAARVGGEFRSRLIPLGYSSAGIVLAVGGNVTDINVGERVACGGGGKANHAEIVSVPRNLVARVPENVSFEEAAFATIGSIVLHGVRRCQLQVEETVIVFGVGLLGQIAIQLVKASGCKVIAVDTDRARVKLAKELGADLALKLGEGDLAKEVLLFTEGIGADAVMICAATPSNEPVNLAMKLIRNKGRVVVVGDVGLGVSRQQFYEKEGDLLISRSYGPGRYDPLYEEKGIDYPVAYARWTENRNMKSFLDLVSEKKVDLKPLINATFDINESKKAYESILSSSEKPLGILIKYNPYAFYSKKRQVALPAGKINVVSKFAESGTRINVALVGAGSFAESIIIPLMSKIPDYNVRAVVAASGAHAKQIAGRVKAEYCATNYRDVLSDKKVDLVVITTPHNLHSKIVIEAAKAGKAIYVEKPLCLNEKELDEITRVISRTKVPILVGFNRRYSPLTLKAKELLKGKHRPFIINYRVNAGPIPKSHWIQDPEIGGGRIIGECCHFLDFFNCTIGSAVESVDAKIAPINDKTVFAQDNLIASTRWTDGSIAALTYTSLGHSDYPKEYIEIHAEGSTIVIDDFREMRLFGFAEKNITLKKQDKGHRNQLMELVNLVRGKPTEAMSFAEAVKSMSLTFEVERRAREGTKEEAP
jgi:predicted dehydrogenase/threonine dehydrogenase-like Zn-dependent dehydrogenase